MAHDAQRFLRKLEIMRREVDWKVEKERRMFMSRFYDLIEAWSEQAVISKRRKTQLDFTIELQDILQPKELDEVLIDSLESERESSVKTFIRFVIETDYKDEPELNEECGPLVRRATPIHRVARGRSDLRRALVSDLFEIYQRYDVNYIDESGLTHLHVACMSDCADVVEKFLAAGQDPNCVWRETGDSPLHIALTYGYAGIVEMLLRYGADPNCANKKGTTPLHIISQCSPKGLAMAIWMSEVSHAKNHPLRFDAQDEVGNTALHMALRCASEDLVVWLMRRITKPNLADLEGWTTLHVICDREDEYHHCEEDEGIDDFSFFYCSRGYEISLVNLFLELHGDVAQVDARDRHGDTPLHVALVRERLDAAELLLRWGANPNLANAQGVTPLHLICQHDHTDRLMKKLFEYCEARNQQVYIDASDHKGRTALQWAVARFLPKTVDLLLNHGADLTHFVFPDVSQFNAIICEMLDRRAHPNETASRALGVVEGLRRAGYRLSMSDAMTYMKLFDNHGWNKEVVKTEIGTLCREWALGCFLEVTHYRLPIIPSEMILENLSDEDIYDICTAVSREY